jgi:uncharacterized membrane protein YfcA
MDVKAAVVILILSNLVMDGIQARRGTGFGATLRRHGVLYACGVVGTFVGTALLRAVPDRVALLVLGAVLLVWVGLTAAGLRLRVRQDWERTISPPLGFVAGVVGGLTGVAGTPLALYFAALGMDKVEFVRSIAVSFIVYKLAQLVAVVWAGLMTVERLGLSLAAVAIALGSFALGLAVQDRMSQRAFNRAVLCFLAVLGVFLVYRALG